MTNPANPAQPRCPHGSSRSPTACDDLEAACHEWAQRVGAGPFLVRRHLPVRDAQRRARRLRPQRRLRPVGPGDARDHPAARVRAGQHARGSRARQLGPGQPLRVLRRRPRVASAALVEQGMPLTMSLTSSSGMEVHFHDARARRRRDPRAVRRHRAPARLLRQGGRPRRRLGRVRRRPLHRPVLTYGPGVSGRPCLPC